LKTLWGLRSSFIAAKNNAIYNDVHKKLHPGKSKVETEGERHA